ncbi:MAG: hypothetical protein AAGD96_17290, partial [Chloroflexota bacterium]
MVNQTDDPILETLIQYLRLAYRTKASITYSEHFLQEVAGLPHITNQHWESLKKIVHLRFSRDMAGAYALSWIILQRVKTQPESDINLQEIAFFTAFAAARWMKKDLLDAVHQDIQAVGFEYFTSEWKARINWTKLVTPWTLEDIKGAANQYENLQPICGKIDKPFWPSFFKIEFCRSYAFHRILSTAYDQARDILAEAISSAKIMNDEQGHGRCLLTQAVLEHRQGNPSKAIQTLEDAESKLEKK